MLDELFGKVKQCTENQFCLGLKGSVDTDVESFFLLPQFQFALFVFGAEHPQRQKKWKQTFKSEVFGTFSTGSKVAIKEERPLVDTTFVLDLIWNIRRFIVRPSGLSCCVHLVSCLVFWITLIDKSFIFEKRNAHLERTGSVVSKRQHETFGH